MPVQFREDRQKCYNARDKFWSCMDSNNEDTEKCKKFRKEFEKLCSKQWVIHFDRKRKYEKFKAQADLNNWELPQSEKESHSSV